MSMINRGETVWAETYSVQSAQVTGGHHDLAWFSGSQGIFVTFHTQGRTAALVHMEHITVSSVNDSIFSLLDDFPCKYKSDKTQGTETLK